MGLAAIDVDLVHFSKCKLIVSWNAMENVIRAVHVVTVQVISVHVCVQLPLHLMRFNKFCSW